MSRERKYWKRNQMITLLAAAVLLLVGLLGGSGVSVAPGPEALMLTMHDGTSRTLAYEAITAVEMLEDADYGTVVNGKENRSGRSGTWQSPQWGSYTLCVYGSCDLAVRITARDGEYLVNLPSEEETRQLSQLLADKIPASR